MASGPSNVALQVRQNAEEYNSFLSELRGWEKEIKAKDKAAKEKPNSPLAIPPVRRSGTLDSSTSLSAQDQSSPKEEQQLKPKIKAYDYRAWDKFDVDKALEEVEAGAQSSSVVTDSSARGGGMAGAVEDPAEALEKSLIEKEKVLTHQLWRDFKKAALCYTKSMKHDPSNSVVPVNRAMAYLKLGRFTEAEADCTLGLSLDKKNVKALWRRGIARRELGKFTEAKKDLEEASVLEPSNKAVKEELQKVYDATKSKANDANAAKKAPAKKDSVTKDAETPAKPVRRRLNIEVVGQQPQSNAEAPQPRPISLPATETASAPTPKESTSRLINLPPTPTANSPEPTPPQSPARTAPAGIKRSSSQLSISSTRSGGSRPAPKSMFEFERDWKSMRGDEAAIYEYMKNTIPSDYSKILKNSLESHYLSKIISVMQNHYLRDEKYDDVYEILLNLSRVQRFDMIIMFLSKAEKAGLAGIIARLRSVVGTGEFTGEDLDKLARLYKV
ncbi:RNA polymerase II-associated protein 3 [Rhizophlyctis rosea]|nr:RNA polymerase II-associated protein 3 [Rhizophlyctis rosea]